MPILLQVCAFYTTTVPLPQPPPSSSSSSSSGERFYLRTLLTAVKGATSFADLRTFQGVEAPTFRHACLLHGLLDDDGEWHMCLQEASAMQTGRQLRHLFVTILNDCAPLDPLSLWLQFCHHICDDLHHALHHGGIRLNPSQDDVLDYGLFLIDHLLSAFGKSLERDWPMLPRSQQDWQLHVSNPLIAEQLHYDQQQQTQLANHLMHSFNPDQLAAFDAIVDAVDSNSGQTFFLHGAGGTGKTYVYNALCAFLRGQGKIVICVASSGVAALLLDGGRTSHSFFKIPIAIHESSTCAIPKNSNLAALIRVVHLIIWDEAPMQHRHIHEAVNRSLQDICSSHKPFGGLPVVFGGDFRQILPVMVRGSRPQIVGACIQRSHLWSQVKVLHLNHNMHLNLNILRERAFAQWQLNVGSGVHTDQNNNNILLPDNFGCPQNSVSSLISSIYPGIHLLPHPPDHYFCQRTILSSRNDDVDDLNLQLLTLFPGEVQVYHAHDQITDEVEGADVMYPVEYLNSINCSGLPLAQLSLKIGCPVIVLRNLNLQGGLCNGTRGIVTRMGNKVVEVRLITGHHAGDRVFIPRMVTIPSETQVPFQLKRRQFPLRLSFAMTINKAQGQSVEHVGLDLRSPVFTHGQFYVAVSRVTSVDNIKVIWDPKIQSATTKNIVYPEVLLH
jgi:hypothetical protein